VNAVSATPAVAPPAAASTVRGAGFVEASSVTVGMARSSAVLSVAAGLVGVLSYACTVVMAHLLTTGDYIDYSAAQALLTSVGVVASALIPLPLSQIVRAHPAGSPLRRRGMAFAVWISLLTGAAAAVALTGVAVLFASLGVAVVVGVAGLALFVIMPTWGWLQGELRFGCYAGVSVAEVGLRLGFSVIAALCGWGAAGALGGFIVGAVVVALTGLVWARRDLDWSPQVVADRGRWAETGGIALVQLVLTGLVGADVVLVALLGDPASPAVAGYQAVATLAKGPVYVAAATMLISFPLLRPAPPERAAAILRQALRSFGVLALPAAAVLATVPARLALLVLPAQYVGSLSVLPWLAVAGLGYGAVTVLAVMLLAVRMHRRSLLGLLVAVVALGAGLLAGWFADRTDGLAIGAAIGAVAAAIALALLARPLLPTALAGPLARLLAGSALFAAVLFAARSLPALWVAAVVLGGLVVLRASGHQPGRHTTTTATGAAVPMPYRRLSVLHLGFEDPAAPGAGGGSLRTHEINRRLVAAGHRVTVLTTRFPGCIDRTSDGVRYMHIGIGAGRTRLTRLLGYLLGLPSAVRGSAADLVVEDFFAPISTIAAPLWTGRPTIGVVQWLNAREKARQYKLPFQLVERFGVRHHHRLIAVSEGIADRLRAMNPRAVVEVIANGVDPAAFDTTPQLGSDVVFIGRLEIAQKGLDLLLAAWAAASPHIAGQLVIAGTGPDEQRLRDQAAQLSITDRVRFVGWIAGAAKYQLLAAARLVVVPSRYETFGIVAIEALATGTPVVAFDIPCLREVIPIGCGQLVAPFDVAAYAQAITELYHDFDAIIAAAPCARAFAVGYDWDALADRQQRAYITAVGRRRAARGLPQRIVALGNGNTGDEDLMAVTLHRFGTDAEANAVLGLRFRSW
jgi:glycosyltransferase involved in cell wall biosynthesis/O-antigen/teichoic acid export membrane protein